MSFIPNVFRILMDMDQTECFLLDQLSIEFIGDGKEDKRFC